MDNLKSMYQPPHPGEFIREVYLADSDLQPTEIARDLDISVDFFQKVLEGIRPVDKPLAIALSRVFGRSVESWLALQSAYDSWQQQSQR